MVNTFVCDYSLYEIAKHLDDSRLNKQITEADQIIDALIKKENDPNFSGGFINHPATKMWTGHVLALQVYRDAMLNEWRERGKNYDADFYGTDPKDIKIIQCEFDGFTSIFHGQFNEYTFPPWFSFPPLIESHRAALLMKDPNYYGNFWNDDLYLENFKFKGYFWPKPFDMSPYYNWNMSYISELGTGVPAYLRYSYDECIKWLSNPSVNPQTGAKIKFNGPKYKEYIKACKGHNIQFNEMQVSSFFNGNLMNQCYNYI